MKLLISLLSLLWVFPPVSGDVIVFETTPSRITLHWKDSIDAPYRSFGSLFYNNKNLVFATNGGMFAATLNRDPLGLYIEKGKKLHPLRKVNNPKFNFGMQPQGVFFITKNNAARVVTIGEYSKVNEASIKYANQSAPMLVMDGKINPQLTHSSSLNIRNGVGVKANGNVVLIVSKQLLTLRQFAQLFIDNECVSSLYMDGGLSNGLTPDTFIFDGCECYGPFIGVTN
jgi:uncharacterized protein YigE (DUF2233 family)